MERDPRKVSSVLGDPTRYEIYRFVVQAPQRVSVQDVAGRFGIHPNVARMHLSKLSEIGLVLAMAVRTGKGGRPGFMYEPSGDPVSVSVQGREFGLLADLLVQALMLLGDGAKSAVEQIGLSFGRRVGQEAVSSTGPGAESADVLGFCATVLQRIGIAAHVSADGEGPPRLVLRSCGFKEVAAAHPDYVCRMCRAMVQGISEVCLEPGEQVELVSSLPHGDRECVYAVEGLIRIE